MNNYFLSIIKDINNENDKSKTTFQQYKWDYNHLEEDREDDNIYSYKHHHRKSSNSSIISNNNRINALKFAASNNDCSLPSSPSYSSSSSNNSPNPFKSQNMLKSDTNQFSNEMDNNDMSQSSLRKIKSNLFENKSYNNNDNNNQLFKAKSMISLPSTSKVSTTSDNSINNNSNKFQKKNLFNVNPEDIISRNMNQNDFNNSDLSNRQIVPPTPIIDAENPFLESSTKIKRMFEKKNLFNILPNKDTFQSQATLLNIDSSDDSDSSCPPSPLISRTPLKSKSSKNLRNSNSTLSLSNQNGSEDDDESDAPYKHTRNYNKRMEQHNKNTIHNKKTNKINYTNNNPTKTTILNLNESLDDYYSTANKSNFVYNTRSRTKQNLMININEQNDNYVKVGPVMDPINKKSSKLKTNNLELKANSKSSPLMKENNDSIVNNSFKLTQIKNNNSVPLNSSNTETVLEKETLDNQNLLEKSYITNETANAQTTLSNNLNSYNPPLNQTDIILPQLKSQKSISSFSATNFVNDPFHTSSLTHHNSLNINDTKNLSNTPNTNSVNTVSQMKTPTKLSQDDTVKRENSVLSSTSNFVNMILLPKKTPQKTPSSRRRNSMCGDRFIPNYSSGDKETQYNLAGPITPSKGKRRLPPGECDAVKEEHNKIYDSVVKLELLGGQDLYDNPLDKINKHRTTVYSFKTPKKRTYQMMDSDSPSQHKYSLTPVSQASQNLLLTPRKVTRHISKTPYKVLDAPELQDDFYLNLVDWSSTNQLSVGLGSCVYLWSACNSRVTRLCDLGPFDSVTSVSWMQKGTHLAVGTNRGLVQLWDIQRGRKIRQFTGHQARVGSLAWNGDILTSGSRDRQILNRDIRVSNDYTKKYLGHKQEVCGLKWNYEENQLASGGNDNKLIIWDKSSTTPLYRLEDHIAAVKAVSWSPHQHGLLASGGGTADRKILFWNTLNGQCIQGIDTGSQVCNLSWSKTTNELVSTHGYSQNQIIIWKYPSMHQIATLIGHTYRVLYLAMSPDGQNIVTGAGDETLRFWNVFNKSKSKETQNGALSSFGHIR